MSTPTINNATSTNAVPKAPRWPDLENWEVPAAPVKKPEAPAIPVPTKAKENTQVAALVDELDTARALMPLQDDPALTEVWSDKERKAERQLAELLRSKGRDQRERVALTELKRERRKQETEDALADVEQSDRLWHQRALSQRRRLLDPSARLAQLQRTHRWVNSTLIGVAVAGIAWSAVNVQHNIAKKLPMSDPMWWLSFFVEPLVSLPLVVLLAMRGVAARWGRTFGGWQVVCIEVALLIVTTLLNVGPYLGIGVPFQGFPALLGHLIAPAMVATAVLLQPTTSAFIGDVLTQAYADASEIDGGRMKPDAAEQIELIRRVRAALAAGDLKPVEGSHLPSISAIQKYLGIGKEKAQATHDALVRLS